MLEVIWTAVPVLILVIIAIPSFKLLYYVDVEPETELTIKATGHQWYWTYTYPDNGNFTFDANMIADSDLQDGQLRLLETDNRVVVPVGTNVRIQTTADDVLHSWAVPQFGVKVDAVPGPPEPALDQCRASPASTMASARSCVASITASCRSPSRPRPARISTPGSPRPRPSSPAPTRRPSRSPGSRPCTPRPAQ